MVLWCGRGRLNLSININKSCCVREDDKPLPVVVIVVALNHLLVGTFSLPKNAEA